MIEYYNNEDSIEVIQKELFSGTIHSGLMLLPEDIVVTKNSHAEFQAPDTSILLASPNARLQINSMDTVSDADITSLQIENGKIRLIVAKGASTYQVTTRPFTIETLYGEVLIESVNDNFTATVYSGTSIIIEPDGKRVELMPKMQYQGSSRTVETPSTSLLLEGLRSFPFRWLQPEDVRGYVDPFTIQQQITTATPRNSPPALVANTEENERPFRLQAAAGTLTQGQYTYGHFSLSPMFASENITFKLYLPLTFRGPLTNPDNWYYPAGNSEWSFSSDKDWSADPLDAGFDLINDILLKIDEFRVFTPQSPFYLKIGHLQQLSMGSLVRAFDNTPAYPYRRKSGLHTKINAGIFNLQFFAEEVTQEALYGLRLALNPPRKKGGGVEFGATILMDLGLSREGTSINTYSQVRSQIIDQWGYLVTGIDLHIPFIVPNQSALNIVLDAHNLLFFTRTPFSFYTETLWSQKHKNLLGLGASLGLGGRNAEDRTVNFRYLLSLQYQSPLVPPLYVIPDYEYSRLLLLDRFVEYLIDQDNARYTAYTLAINADIGMKIGNWMDLQVFYSLPLAITGGNFTLGTNDFLLTSLKIGQDEWPVQFGTYLQINQLPELINGSRTFLSVKNRIGGNINITIKKVFELSFSGSTILMEDSRGNYLFDEGFILGGSISILAKLKL